MQAICFEKHGTVESVLKKEAIAAPSLEDCGSGEVLIEVEAAAINPVDKYILGGDMALVLPCAFTSKNKEGKESKCAHVMSYDVSGKVGGLPRRDSKFKFGDEVFARIFHDGNGKVPHYRGSMAQRCVVRESDCCLKPDNITFEEAAGVPLVTMTALQALNNAGLKEGDSCFISGGAGGVGNAAIQLAKHHFKCSRVVTTASTGAGTDLCKKLGADEVVDYKTAKFETVYNADDKKFDVCFDTTDEGLKMVDIIKSGGKIVSIAGTPTLEEIRRIGGDACILWLFIGKKKNRKEFKNAKKAGADWHYLFLSPSGDDLATIAGLLKDGTIKPVVDSVFDFQNEDATSGWKGAFTRAFSGRAKGKVVVNNMNGNANSK